MSPSSPSPVVDLPAQLKYSYRTKRQRHECSQNHRTKERHREWERTRKCEDTYLYILRILENEDQDDRQNNQHRKQTYPCTRGSRRRDHFRRSTLLNSSYSSYVILINTGGRFVISIARLRSH
jgi:hypothetical protein